MVWRLFFEAQKFSRRALEIDVPGSILDFAQAAAPFGWRAACFDLSVSGRGQADWSA
jgi:hypothetical protein